jgi:hypothetical protein
LQSIEIAANQINDDLKVGDRISYLARIYGSLGIQANIIDSNDAVIQKTNSVFKNKNAQEP